MSKKLIWSLVVIILVIALVFVLVNKSDKESPPGNQGSYDLPEVNEAEYIDLSSSTGSFAALDEAANSLE